MQSLWKHVQYTLYNQRPEELMGAGGARPPAPYTPSAPGYSPPPPAAPAHYAAPPSAPAPFQAAPAYQAAPTPAPYQATPPPGAYTPPPPGAHTPYSAPQRPADYQGPPLGPVGAGGATPQPVQPLPNPYAQMPEKPAARAKPTPGTLSCVTFLCGPCGLCMYMCPVFRTAEAKLRWLFSSTVRCHCVRLTEFRSACTTICGRLSARDGRAP